MSTSGNPVMSIAKRLEELEAAESWEMMALRHEVAVRAWMLGDTVRQPDDATTVVVRTAAIDSIRAGTRTSLLQVC